MSSNSAFLTIKSVNLIYQKDDQIQEYITKKQQNKRYSFKLAAHEATTKSFLLLNPLEKTLTLFDFELELQKVKGRVKLLDIPKAKKTSSKSKFLHHKQSMVLNSGQKQLSILAQNEDEFLSQSPEKDLNESSKNDSLLMNKTMNGYLTVNLKENKKNTLKEVFQSLIHPLFKEKFNKFFANSSFLHASDDEKITVSLLTHVNKSHLIYIIGTNYGNIYVFPFLYHFQWDFYPIFTYDSPTKNIKNIVKKLYVYKNFLFVEKENYKLSVFELNIENELEETKFFFSKTLPTNEFLEGCLSGIHEVKINKWLKDQLYLDSSILEFKRVQTLKFYDENGNQTIDTEQKYSFFKLNIMPVALISQENNVSIYSLQKKKIELTLKGNNALVLKVYIHPFLDEILTFNSKGYLYVFNIPTGVLDRILTIESYAHLFHLQKYFNENFSKHNIHNYKRFCENEEFQLSRQHPLMDYSLRFEGYLLDYTVGKELLLKKPEATMMTANLSTNILSQNTVTTSQNFQDLSNMLEKSNQINSSASISNVVQSQSSSNLNRKSQPPAPPPPINAFETIDESSSLTSYEKKKQDAVNLIIFEKNGGYLSTQQAKKPEKANANEIAGVLNGRKEGLISNNKEQATCILEFNQIKKQSNYDIGHLIFFDAKLNVKNLKTFNDKDPKSKILKSYFSYMSIIFPWGIDKEYDKKIMAKMFFKLPVFNTFYGQQGLGESFSFLINTKDRWGTSDYLSTLQAIGILFFVTSFEEKELKSFTGYMVQIIDAFSKKKKERDVLHSCINLPLICKFFLDSEGDLMTASYNLLISSMKNKNIDYNFVTQCPLELYRLTDDPKFKSDNFSYSQILWILMIGYTSVFNDKTRKTAENCLKEIISLTK